ncbi:hypothetical protein ACFFRR_011634 [Megaselia abdita]
MQKLTVFLIFTVVSSSLAYLDSDGWLNIELHHALSSDPSKFSFRGNITVSSLTNGLANDDQNTLTAEEKQSIIKLAENNDFYRVRATVSYSDGSKNTFLTSTKACTLVSSQLTDVFWVSVDSNGFVTAITETVVGQLPGKICGSGEFQPSDLVEFTSDVLIRQMELGPIPDTASFIQKVEREKEARDKGEVKDNRSFFAKYWMYIVPVVVLVMISGATNPEAGGAK